MKIIAIVHIYYPEIWSELKECLKNIFVPYDLIVTFVAKHEDIENDVINFKYDAKIMHTDNSGYDVGPFMQALNTVNLDDYDLLIKLHSKRNLNFEYPAPLLNCYNIGLNNFRKLLLSFISDKNNFKKCIKAFENNPDLGMINNYKLVVDEKHENDIQVFNTAKKWLAENNLCVNNFKFVAGTMFIARASLFKVLQKKQFEFNETNRKDVHSNAHVFERFFGAIIYGQNKYIADVFSPVTKPLFKDYLLFLIHPILSFFCKIKITTSQKLLIKICKIPVFRKTLTPEQIAYVNKKIMNLFITENKNKK